MVGAGAAATATALIAAKATIADVKVERMGDCIVNFEIE